MPKSSLFGTQPRVLADFGTICPFIDVVYHFDGLSCILYENKLSRSLTTTTKIFNDNNKNDYPLTRLAS